MATLKRPMDTSPETAVEGLAHTMCEAYTRGALTGQGPLIPWPEAARNEHTFYVYLALGALVWTHDHPWVHDHGGGNNDNDAAR